MKERGGGGSGLDIFLLQKYIQVFLFLKMFFYLLQKKLAKYVLNPEIYQYANLH